MSIDISERDLAFYEDVMEGYTDWWTAPGVRYPTFEELTDILFGKVSKVYYYYNLSLYILFIYYPAHGRWLNLPDPLAPHLIQKH